MGKILRFPTPELPDPDNTPHTAGEAVCLACRHEWVQDPVPVGTVKLKCPACGCWGHFTDVCYPEDQYWECNCGCSLFTFNPEKIVCAHCGVAQEFGYVMEPTDG